MERRRRDKLAAAVTGFTPGPSGAKVDLHGAVERVKAERGRDMSMSTKRVCLECRRGNHRACDSEDVIGNMDYCGPSPICACLGSDDHPV